MRLDCVEFDPVPAKLYLSVYASEEFDCSVGPLTHAIAGAVEACTGPRRERILNKLLRCEFWLVYIAQRYAGAAGIELSVLTYRDRPPAGIEHVDGGALNGRSDGNRFRGRCVVRDGVAAGKRRILGGSIAVDDAAGRERLQSLHDVSR